MSSDSSPSLSVFKHHDTSDDRSADFDEATAGSLRQTTSKDTGRYDRTATIIPLHALIEPGFNSSNDTVPEYLPAQWSAHIHPEGQLYFCRNSSPRIVTEAYLYRRDILAKVTFWIKSIEEKLAERRLAISDNVELFIQIDEDDCAYYFVDHLTRTEFWLEAFNTEDLNMFPVASPSHLKLALEELYWSHLEHFPMHGRGISAASFDELVSVFTHAAADHMTSKYSTFPYSALECTKFLELLNGSRERRNDGHTICLVARLWSLIFNHRFSTYYGEEYARLSRDQSILVDSARESRFMGNLTSILSFKTSNTYTTRLNDIFTDRLVYLHQWQPFVSSSLRDWRTASYMTLPILMLHALLFFVQSSALLAIISVSCLGASFLSSVLLVHRHEELEDASAVQALSYLETIRSERFKFQLVGFVYSLPKSLYLWGLGAFFVNWVVVLAGYLSTGTTVGLLCTCLLALLAFQRTTSQNDGRSFSICTCSLLRFYQKKAVAEEEESLV